MREIAIKIKSSKIFMGMSEDDIVECLKESNSIVEDFGKEELVFHIGDEAKYINILIEGTVNICRDSIEGKRSIVAIFSEPGEMFGEVFLFLKNNGYEHYAKATTKLRILKIPKLYLFEQSQRDRTYQKIFLSNMLTILASKNYYLNRRVQILSCSSLRQKIAMYLLQNKEDGDVVKMSLGREELADILNTARPSLSRELMSMQDEGIIEVKKHSIYIKDMEALELA